MQVLSNRPTPRFGYIQQVGYVDAISRPNLERYLSSGFSEPFDRAAPRGSYVDISI